jgi:hypothetical protein
MNDKELDDFFRKQSENPDIPYQEADWERLRRKLDAPPEINGAKRGNQGWWIGLLALIVISGAGLGWKYWGEENAYSKNTTGKFPSNLVFDSSNMGISNEIQKVDEADHPITKDSLAAQVAVPTSDPMPQPTNGLTQLKEQPSNQEAPINSKSPAFGSSNRVTVAVPVKHYKIAPIEASQDIQPLSLYLVTGDQKQQIPENLPKDTKKQTHISGPKADKNTIEGSRFYTTLTLAPDVSALRIKDIQGLGNSIGLNLEYFIHPTISINAGAMYVFKTYQAGDGYSTGYVPTPTHVNGSCWVLDIPLNLRYYAFDQRLSRWYMTGGLSSYLMLREKYDLEYQSYNYGGSTYGNRLEVQNKNKHYLTIINLGIGYERTLTDRLSLQVEPYLKLPIKGIGEGDITLKSAGAFVGLKYGW